MFTTIIIVFGIVSINPANALVILATDAQQLDSSVNANHISRGAWVGGNKADRVPVFLPGWPFVLIVTICLLVVVPAECQKAFQSCYMA